MYFLNKEGWADIIGFILYVQRSKVMPFGFYDLCIFHHWAGEGWAGC